MPQEHEEEQPRREFGKGDKLEEQGGSGNQEQLRGEIIYAGAAPKNRPEGRLGDKAAAAAKSPEGKSWRETSLGDKAAAASWQQMSPAALRFLS